MTIAIDTSGSMGANELAACLSECKGILSATGSSLNVVTCDAVVQDAGRVATPNQITALLKGGGGTDFRPVFKHIEKQPVKPDILVFMTDGYGPAPDVPPPGMLVIWLIVCSYGGHKPASWGEYIEVKNVA